jgi:hypothetical protein
MALQERIIACGTSLTAPMKRGYFAFLPYRYRILLGYGILPGYFPIHIPYVSANFVIKEK